MQKPLYLLLSMNVYTQYTWMCVGVWFWVRVSATPIHLSLFLHTFEKFCELEIWKLCELEQRAASGVYGSAGVIKVPVPTGGRKYLLGTAMQCWSTGAGHSNAMLAMQYYAGRLEAIFPTNTSLIFSSVTISTLKICLRHNPRVTFTADSSILFWSRVFLHHHRSQIVL